MKETDHLTNEIRLRAYFLWVHCGKPQGRDVEFWLSAERAVIAADKAHHKDVCLPERY